MDTNYRSRQEYLKIATEIVDEAGLYLIEKFGEVKEIKIKEEKHWSVKEDKECDLMYENFFRKKTPEVGLYTEEGERDLSHDLTWVVDPIEGTTNFGAGIPFFATQACLMEKGVTVVTVLDAPLTKMRFTAILGEGAMLNGKKIKVGEKGLAEALLAVDKGGTNAWVAEVMAKLAGEVRTMRWYGALGLNMALVASGGIDLFINKGSKLYDYAPGVLLVREAGGVAWNLSGEDWSIDDREIIAGNKEIVTEALTKLGLTGNNG